MIVTIDGTDWLYGERAIHRHVVNLVNHIGTFGEDIDYRLFTRCFRKSSYSETPAEKERLKIKRCWMPGRLFNLLNSKCRLFSVDRLIGKTDLYHATGTNLFRCDARHYVYTVGGVAVFIRPDLMPGDYVDCAQALIRRSLSRITHFIAVSEKTREEIMMLFNISPERITTIPLGIDEEFKPLPSETFEKTIEERFQVRKPYVLYVGGIQKNKNIAGLVKAFSIAASKSLKSHQLVLVGPVPWRDREIEEAINNSKVGNRILLVGYHSGKTLVQLYSGADLFVFPSFYEGWTSPPLEAMACGVPVVASNASSIPETVGDAALLVNPDDIEDIAQSMVNIVDNTELKERLVKKGFERSRYFTWERCIRRTVEMYLKLGST